jgi:tetratricopeptide (TPR) repeat protein
MKRLPTTITVLITIAALACLGLIPPGCSSEKSELESKVDAFLLVGDYERAFKLVDVFLQAPLDKPTGYALLERVITAGSTFLSAEHRKQAVKLIDGYIQEYPAKPIGRAMMARVLAADGQTDNAFREYYRLYKLTETISPKLLAEIGRVSLNKSNDSGEVKSNESGGVGDKRDVPALIYSLNDSDYSVRESAVGALGPVRR